MKKSDAVKLALKGWSIDDIRELKKLEADESTDDAANIDEGDAANIDDIEEDSNEDDEKDVDTSDNEEQDSNKALLDARREIEELNSKLKKAQNLNINSNAANQSDNMADLIEALKDIY